MKSNASLYIALLSGAVLALAPVASANTVTFGQLDNFGAQSFIFTDTGSGGILSGSIPIEFQYENISGGNPLPGEQLATLTLNFTSTESDFAVGSQLFEGGFVGSFSITLNAPVDGLTNLLSGTILTPGGTLAGVANGSSATFSDSTPPPGAVSFSSDFITFPNPVSQGFSFSLSSANPFFGDDGSGHIASFDAAGTGTFDSNPPPTFTPEPASMLLLGGGLIALSAFGRKRLRSRQ